MMYEIRVLARKSTDHKDTLPAGTSIHASVHERSSKQLITGFAPPEPARQRCSESYAWMPRAWSSNL